LAKYQNTNFDKINFKERLEKEKGFDDQYMKENMDLQELADHFDEEDYE